MSTAQALIDDVRARLIEANAGFFSDDVSLLRWLNQGYKNFIAKTEFLEKVTAYKMVANQTEYAVPSDMQSIVDMRWKDEWTVDWRDLEEWNRRVGTGAGTGDRPEVWRLFPSTSKFRVYPIPNAASTSSAMNDTGGINSSDTSVIVTSGTNFPTRGRILIDSEQIMYYAKSGNTLSQLVRGDGGTTAAAHSDTTVVYHAPLEVYHSYMPPLMVVSTVDCQLPAEYDEGLIAYALSIAFRAKDKYETSGAYFKIYKEFLDMGMDAVAQRQKQRLPCIKDEQSGETMYG